VCGRFTRSSPLPAIAAEFGVRLDRFAAATPRFNVCPGEEVLVVARGADSSPDAAADGSGSEEAVAGFMRWGLVPWFASDPGSGPRPINARAETIASRPAFREAFARRRCLVVADGFYEWRRHDGVREPWFIRLRSRRPVAFAGIWERWTPARGEPLLSCAIVTCAANALVAPIHDRMPVIVPRAAHAAWLARATVPQELVALLRPCPEDVMEAYRVSRYVNATRNEGPECIRPATDDPAGP
jgi:putative SOS response-associated peptidase YedK